MLRETVAIHAPYTHIPYHQRLDGGSFASSTTTTACSARGPACGCRSSCRRRYLPLAQTIWYLPTGLDLWSQLLGKMPGHYARSTYDPRAHDQAPAPECHFGDQTPLYLEGTFEERLNQWLTLVQRGEVERAYRVFLALFEEEERRPRLLAQLMFAGLINVQDRMLWNRSYTTGHKAYRARATIELGEAVGWENAHAIVYAGVPDMAVGPHWYSAYEMACQVCLNLLEDEPAPSAIAATRASARDQELFANEEPLSGPEADALVRALTRAHEPAYIDEITALLRAGRSPRRILDTVQIAAAQVLLEVGTAENYSMPQHGYEYTNSLRWFYNRFTHPHRVTLLYVAGSFVNQCALWVRNTPGNGRGTIEPPRAAETLSRDQILARLDAAMLALHPDESAAWTQAYLEGGHARDPLIKTLAAAAAKHGNDPTTKRSGSASWRTSCTPHHRSATPSCWLARRTPRAIASSATRSRPTDASPRPLASRPASRRGARARPHRGAG